MKSLEKYQTDGVAWCQQLEINDEDRCGFLCDEMGLGKTIQMCHVIQNTLKHDSGPTLICSMLNNCKHWINELQTTVNITAFDPPRNFSGRLPSSIDVVVISYSMFHKNSPSWIFKTRWGRIIMDEGHTASNPKTKLHKALANIPASCRWILTATPIQNKQTELLAMANGLLHMKTRDIDYILNHHYLRRTHGVQEKQLQPLNAIIQMLEFKYPEERELYELVQDYYNRKFIDDPSNKRNKAKMMEGIIRLRQICVHSRLFFEGVQKSKEVKNNPQKTMCTKRKTPDVSDTPASDGGVELSQEEFDKEWDIMWQTINDGEGEGVDEGNSSPSKTQEEAIRDALRLYRDGIASMKGVPCIDTQSLINGISDVPDFDILHSSKIEWLVSDIKHHYKNEKILVFFTFVEELKLVKSALESNDIPTISYQGGMSKDDKDRALSTFTQTSIPIMLMQIKCGGVGLNLQCASRLYITCPSYNPCIDMQAVGRVYRKGQTCQVTAIRLVMKGTIEERCLEISERKINNIKATLGNESASVFNGELSKCESYDVLVS
jgi:SWI/SNF-related matrix-associated actin-dependent regulator of chromatin subfamily A3